MSRNFRLNGLVLNGGKSARMGQDKGLIVLHEKPQREHLLDLIRPFCDKVYLSCKKRDGLPSKLHPIEDVYTGDTPLVGIMSAFRHSPDCHWLVVAVDMPQVSTASIETLINHHDPHKMATCYLDSDGKKPDPMLAIWSVQSFPSILEFYDGGGISPREYLLNHPITLIESNNPRILTNINSPEDLDRYRKNHH